MRGPKAVPPDSDYMETLLPEGRYDGVFIRSERRTTPWRRSQWLLVAQLVPPFPSVRIPWWMTIPNVPGEARVAPLDDGPGVDRGDWRTA